MKTSLSSKSSQGSKGGFTLQFSQFCNACHGHSKAAKREFSEQAWAALVSWGEVPSEAVDTPICNDCYFNFRDVLIDRAEEVSVTTVQNAAVHKIPRSATRAVNG